MRRIIFLLAPLFAVFLSVNSFAVDAGFESAVLHEKPLSTLVGENPLPVVEEYFVCMQETDDENVCQARLQNAGSERLGLVLGWYRERCRSLGRSGADWENVANHIISRNYLLANTLKSLAMGLEHHTDDMYGRGTLWSVFYASQDAVVGTLTALARDSVWVGPSYEKAKACEKTGLDLQVCMTSQAKETASRRQKLVALIASKCLGENQLQCMKTTSDYERYFVELERALYVMDSFARKDPMNSQIHVGLILGDLEEQVLRMLLAGQEKE